MEKKKKGRKKKLLTKKDIRMLSFLFLIIGIGLCIYSSIHLYMWYKDSKQIKEINEEIQEQVTIHEVEDDAIDETQPQESSDNNIEIVKPKQEVSKNNPYWNYIRMNLIDVDFSKLKKTNSDVKGWIQVNGTNINYPFVQTDDNSYYLTHSFDKSRNGAGWVFLDYRNDISTLDQNTILYAHARLDKTMFGSLKNILKNDWYYDTDNHIIKLSNDYLQIHFSSEKEFENFAKKLQKRSKYKFDTTVSGSDKILTLSTCYSNNEKLVMHAKLIKIQNK